MSHETMPTESYPQIRRVGRHAITQGYYPHAVNGVRVYKNDPGHVALQLRAGFAYAHVNLLKYEAQALVALLQAEIDKIPLSADPSPEALAREERRIADLIDGYDRDDLGESSDF